MRGIVVLQSIRLMLRSNSEKDYMLDSHMNMIFLARLDYVICWMQPKGRDIHTMVRGVMIPLNPNGFS